MKRTALLLLTAMVGTAALTVSAQQTTDRVRALPGDSARLDPDVRGAHVRSFL